MVQKISHFKPTWQQQNLCFYSYASAAVDGALLLYVALFHSYDFVFNFVKLSAFQEPH